MSVRSATEGAGEIPKTSVRSQRLWEVDTLRGVAIVTMVHFHLMWSLWFFGVTPNINWWTGFWKYYQRSIACTFLLLVGVSLTLSYHAAMRRRGPNTRLFPKFLKRGLKVFGLGVIISIVVWLAGVGYMHFGVLHLIGFSIIAAYPLLRFRWLNLALWAVFFTLGFFLQGITIDMPYFAWLGLEPPNFAPLDRFPVIPWFGVVLLGVFLGNTFYDEQGRRRFFLPDWGDVAPFRFLQFLGRHSLIIYLFHQPIIFAILFALGLAQL